MTHGNHLTGVAKKNHGQHFTEVTKNPRYI